MLSAFVFLTAFVQLAISNVVFETELVTFEVYNGGKVKIDGVCHVGMQLGFHQTREGDVFALNSCDKLSDGEYIKATCPKDVYHGYKYIVGTYLDSECTILSSIYETNPLDFSPNEIKEQSILSKLGCHPEPVEQDCVENNDYAIRTCGAGKRELCLQVSDDNKTVQASDCNGSKRQQWIYNHWKYTIHNKQVAGCLHSSQDEQNHVLVVMAPCNKKIDQIWSFPMEGTLKNGKNCVDVDGFDVKLSHCFQRIGGLTIGDINNQSICKDSNVEVYEHEKHNWDGTGIDMTVELVSSSIRSIQSMCALLCCLFAVFIF